jgi:hypothetical protein
VNSFISSSSVLSFFLLYGSLNINYLTLLISYKDKLNVKKFNAGYGN